MRRLLFPLSLLFVAACDPDLTVATTPGADAASEVSVGPGPGPVTPNDGGVDEDAGTTDDGGTTDDDGGTTTTTHKIDGDNDFKASEKFVTSSTGNGYEGYIAWDAKNLYVGMAGNDIGAGASGTKWVLVYLEGASGTTAGVSYNGQQPTLPFSAEYHVGLKTDLTYTNKLKWDGAAWVDAGVSLIPVAQKKGSFVEVAIPRAAIGGPTKLKVHVSMINEQSGSEWTYSAIPSTSLTDGVDPDYTKYFDFDLNDTTKAPNQYTPQ